MPRRRDGPIAGQYYHLYNRGNDRQPIFFGRGNYLFFLKRIHTYLVPCMDMIAYCLMPNHYHLLVRINDGDVSHAMQLLALSYTMAVNKQRDRVGALFQGAFRSRHVDRDEYLVHLSRYFHLNPVRAGLAEQPEE